MIFFNAFPFELDRDLVFTVVIKRTTLFQHLRWMKYLFVKEQLGLNA